MYDPAVAVSPLDLHAASPAELQQRVIAERRCSAFLVLRDGDGKQRIVDLAGHDRLSIGRRPSSDIVLSWDREVSRLHAELVRSGTEWFVCDDGLSHNGTFVGGERVHGRRRLRDGDVAAIGGTLIAFIAPPSHSSTAPTITSANPRPEVRLTPSQRRVLVALCRPYRDSAYAAPPRTGRSPTSWSSPSTPSRARCVSCSNCSRSMTCRRTRSGRRSRRRRSRAGSSAGPTSNAR